MPVSASRAEEIAKGAVPAPGHAPSPDGTMVETEIVPLSSFLHDLPVASQQHSKEETLPHPPRPLDFSHTALCSSFVLQQRSSTSDPSPATFTGPFSPGQAMVVIADSQTAGRGSTGRTWDSSLGNSLFTVVLPTKCVEADTLSVLPLIIGLACRDVLMAYCAASGKSDALSEAPTSAGKEASDKLTSEKSQSREIILKWPNDILYDQEKLSGCIVEQSADSLLVGIGINVNLAPDLSKASGARPTTCLRNVLRHVSEGGVTPDTAGPLPALDPMVINCLCTEQLFLRIAACPSRADVVAEYSAALDWSVPVTRRGDGGKKGNPMKAVKLNEWGHLVARDDDGSTVTLSGEYLY